MTRSFHRRSSDVEPIPFPVLIADIGGTHARLAILSQPHSPIRQFPTVQTTDYPNFATAATRAVLDATAIMPKSLLIALAGPLHPQATKLTNADWVIDPAALRDALNLEVVITFNDFEALALSLPHLSDDQLTKIGGGEAKSREPRVVLGPGTGLGVAALAYADKRFTPIAGEGGHISLGPESDQDFAIWPHLERVGGRISGESILCGSGLARLYRAVARSKGSADDSCRTGPEVTDRLAKGDPVASETVDLFVTYLGRFAGDLALVFLAKGGVYIAGGVAPRFAERFQTGRFRAAFEAKAPHAAILQDIPTWLITEQKPAMWGLSAVAQMPERFAIDLSARRWTAKRS